MSETEQLRRLLAIALHYGCDMHAQTCGAWVDQPSGARRIDENSPPCDCYLAEAKELGVEAVSETGERW